MSENMCAMLDSATAPNDLRDVKVFKKDRINRKPLPSVEDLQAKFSYDPQSGVLLHRPGRGVQDRWAGKPAGHKSSRGYIGINLKGQAYWAHRLIWKMLKGYDPHELDHINGDKSDNRIENLRDVSRSENNRNIRGRTSKSGCTGVFFSRTLGAWVAQIRINGRAKHLGAYTCKNEAVAARKGAEIALNYYDF